MEPEFEWDDDNVDHIARHRVSPEEVEEAFADRDRVPRTASRTEQEARWAFIGRTEAGRLLFVVFARRGHEVRVVTARDASATERQVYRRRGKR
ncbi:MAG: BrnT family toxin [Chloroflexi bacterium]|nr:BrnT family toxin [Chloroflexota bacterium]